LVVLVVLMLWLVVMVLVVMLLCPRRLHALRDLGSQVQGQLMRAGVLRQ